MQFIDRSVGAYFFGLPCIHRCRGRWISNQGEARPRQGRVFLDSL